ncbi:hypothetical protein Pint_30494 [Pistacia integerrima]|uniref:Uncharacterized protein n=1 Tax=Pistacia integerrima TaxID=434235 RepID=A0ACC0X0C4_9ROSI|nr:hypothetical protein Pint_30494 [Pistacia integerrima]
MKFFLCHFLLLFSFSASLHAVFCLNSDGVALLSLFRQWTSMPSSLSSSWNSSDSTPCKWVGIECDSKNNVVSFNLTGYAISGQLGPEIGHLRQLETIDLSTNDFFGNIPEELGNCSALKNFDLSSNRFTGQIPGNFKYLQNLGFLSLFSNSLDGEIPESLFRIPGLQVVYLNDNNFNGSIPRNVGDLSEVVTLWLNGNRLSNTIPESIGNCSKLQELYLNDNNLVGVLPESLNNLENLAYLDVSNNSLIGSIRLGSGNCKNFDTLVLSFNNFSAEIPPGLGNCSSLTTLAIVGSNLTGTIPSSFGLLDKLSYLDLCENHLSGKIPPELGQCKSLETLRLYTNQLEGKIPNELGMLSNLQDLELFSNNLTGEIPLSIWKISRLENLLVYSNSLSGELPSELSQLTYLKNISLYNNQFSGVIPQSLGINSSLVQVEFTNNKFTGEIPPNLCFGKQLRVLNMGLNQFHGRIPSDVGPIPESLIKLPDSSPSSFLGNPSLCVNCLSSGSLTCFGNSYLKPCYHHSSGLRGLSRIAIVLIVLGASLSLVFVLLGLVCLFLLQRRSKQELEISAEEGPSSLLNKVMKATENLNDRYVIGKGAHGVVYKALLGPNKVFALKKLVFGGHKAGRMSMIREIETVGKVRHRNLVRLEEFWLRKDCGLVMYRYMENGSLHDVLHATNQSPILEWNVRYKIAIGIAHGLAYLHHDCDPAIVHRDIKPQNILLDSEMEPHISDFGIAKLLDQSPSSTSSIFVPGTVGYIAPENAFTTKKSRESDVYSYGVVLLELITRRKPMDIDIVGWVSSVWSNTKEINHIVDSSLKEEFLDSNIREQVIGLLSVALECTNKEPNNRPDMRQVVKRLSNMNMNPPTTSKCS